MKPKQEASRLWLQEEIWHTPKMATLRTMVAFSGEVKVWYAFEKYPCGAARRGSPLWTTTRCALGMLSTLVEWCNLVQVDEVVACRAVNFFSVRGRGTRHVISLSKRPDQSRPR